MFLIFELGAANELHDNFSVKVTDWEKYNIFVKCFNDKRFVSDKGIKHDEIIKHLVTMHYIILIL